MYRLHWSTSTLGVVAIITLASCGGRDTSRVGDGGSTVSVPVASDSTLPDIPVAGATRSVHGDTIAFTTPAPVHRGEGILVEEVSIGGASGSDSIQFTSILDMVVTANGDALVLDRRVPVVARLSPDGRLVRRYGRTGEGPGEYTSPRAVAEHADGRVLVRDQEKKKILVYAPGGEPREQWEVPESVSWSSTALVPIVSDVNGVTWAYIRTGRRDPPAEPPSAWLRLAADGAIIDTVAAPTLPVLPPARVAAMTPGGSSRVAIIPYRPMAIWTISPVGYLVTGVTSRAVVDLRIPTSLRQHGGASARGARWSPGDSVISLRWSTSPVDVSDTERNEWRSAITATLRRTNSDWKWTGPDMEKIKPAYDSIIVARDGRIWLRAAKKSEERLPEGGARPTSAMGVYNVWHQPQVYDVVELNGVHAGRVAAPDGLSIRSIRGDNVWGVQTTADGVPVVKRYSIRWPPTPPAGR